MLGGVDYKERMMKQIKLKQIDRTDKRTLILASAIEVFAKSGYSNATINDVAIKAGIANGTVYLYFNSKVDLFVQAMREVISSKLNEIKNIISKVDSPIDKLYMFINLHIELFTKNRDAVRFMVVEWRQSEDFYRKNPGYNPFNEYLNYVSSLCSEAVESGAIRKVNPRTLAYMIVGTMDFVMTQWISDAEEIDLLKLTEEMSEILREGLLHREDTQA
jgi:TetR/AcrR family fatty acid metabolism transcriptional regulator